MKFKSARQIPSEGSVQGVLAEIYHVGEVDTPWGVKDKVKFIFEITENREGTEIPLTVAQDFNNTWSKKSTLYGFVEKLLGRQLTIKESGEFDPEFLIGKNAFLTILHRESNGKVYANIKSVMPMIKGMPEISISEHYVPFAQLMEKWNKEREENSPESGIPVDSAPSNVNTADYTV